MAKENGDLVSVKIIPNEQGRPPGKLADAEVVFCSEQAPGIAHEPGYTAG